MHSLRGITFRFFSPDVCGCDYPSFFSPYFPEEVQECSPPFSIPKIWRFLLPPTLSRDTSRLVSRTLFLVVPSSLRCTVACGYSFSVSGAWGFWGTSALFDVCGSNFEVVLPFLFLNIGRQTSLFPFVYFCKIPLITFFVNFPYIEVLTSAPSFELGAFWLSLRVIRGSYFVPKFLFPIHRFTLSVWRLRRLRLFPYPLLFVLLSAILKIVALLMPTLRLLRLFSFPFPFSL